MSQGGCEYRLCFPDVTPGEIAHDAYPVSNRLTTDGALVFLRGLLCVLLPTPRSRSSHRSVSASATRITTGTLSLQYPCTRSCASRVRA
jgi:hypothetical protein